MNSIQQYKLSLSDQLFGFEESLQILYLSKCDETQNTQGNKAKEVQFSGQSIDFTNLSFFLLNDKSSSLLDGAHQSLNSVHLSLNRLKILIGSDITDVTSFKSSSHFKVNFHEFRSIISDTDMDGSFSLGGKSIFLDSSDQGDIVNLLVGVVVDSGVDLGVVGLFWKNIESDHGAWIEGLVKAFSSVSAEFESELNGLREVEDGKGYKEEGEGLGHIFEGGLG
mmetsp:Transcript_25294/g.22311  ORF Transcript_25294/g.22311 Transcript_25294/m.22311 type:complete len:223 (-) Transcript_25294:3-671(-)